MSKNIYLIDVDSKIPNLALMKIAAYHKNIGNHVDWWQNVVASPAPDIIYISKVFDFTPDYIYQLPDCEIVRGGTGYDITKKLPDQIESCDPDYSIYYNCDYSLQLYSRGCTRNCRFCIVKRKEGCLRPVSPMMLNPKGKWIHVLDNNFFASKLWRESLDHLIECDQPVKFDGVDIRTLTEEQSCILNKVKLKGQIHIAWDNTSDKVNLHILSVLKHGHIKAYKLMCYVLIGFNSTREEDMFRVEELRKLGVDPFVMPYDKNDEYQKRFARWVNMKAIFKSVKWEEYK